MKESSGAALWAEAEEHLRGELDRAIYNHSQRVRLLALDLASNDDALDADALVIAALFHDAGTARLYNGPDRFEVEGAHAAARFLTQHRWPQARIKPVWDAIALHTSPGIAENAGLLPALIRGAVRVDFGAQDVGLPGGQALIAHADYQFPRERIEVVLADSVTAQVAQAHDTDRKAPATSWAANLMAGLASRDPLTGKNPTFNDREVATLGPRSGALLTRPGGAEPSNSAKSLAFEPRVRLGAGMMRHVSNSVQFGRAKQSFRQRWVFFIYFAAWCLMCWLFHASQAMVSAGLGSAMVFYWSTKDLDRGARVERGIVILRTGRKEERVPASEVTAYRVEKTPGWLMRSVYVRIERGRFNSFDVLRAKAPDTIEGRQRPQAKVDEASTLLHSEQGA